VRRAWGLPLRDSYGQTETTMMIGNSPGQRIVPGSMGRPLPGYRVALIDALSLKPEPSSCQSRRRRHRVRCEARKAEEAPRGTAARKTAS